MIAAASRLRFCASWNAFPSAQNLHRPNPSPPPNPPPAPAPPPPSRATPARATRPRYARPRANCRTAASPLKVTGLLKLPFFSAGLATGNLPKMMNFDHHHVLSFKLKKPIIIETIYLPAKPRPRNVTQWNFSDSIAPSPGNSESDGAIRKTARFRRFLIARRRNTPPGRTHPPTPPNPCRRGRVATPRRRPNWTARSSPRPR